MQPYPFPYIGYFELMASTDAWVVFDVVKYNRRSWMNRNRILHPHQGWQYFSIPVEHAPLGTAISDVRLVDPQAAERRLLAQLEHYKRRAPGHAHVTDMVRDTFSRAAGASLVDFNTASLIVTAERLGIAFAPVRCSKLGVPLEDISHPGAWALRISAVMGASEYINPPGGIALFKPSEWMETGIRLRFTSMNALRYDCGPYAFHENLSILDVLMWCSSEEIAMYLRQRHSEQDTHGS